MKHILVVEDDLDIGGMIERMLIQAGCRVTRAYSGTEAVLALKAERPDLMLLDLMLPGIGGEAVMIHAEGVPVIVLSARGGVQDKVSLLRMGAADYMTKPFDLDELLARVEVQLRRAGAAPGGRLQAAGLTLEESSRSALVGDTPVRLTRTEYAILHLLIRNPDQALPRALVLERIAQDTPDCTESSLKMHVSNLRRKLREAGCDAIESVWGIGYILKTGKS